MSDLEKKKFSWNWKQYTGAIQMSKNAEFIGFPDSVSDNELENEVVETFPAINIEIWAMALKTVIQQESLNIVWRKQW